MKALVFTVAFLSFPFAWAFSPVQCQVSEVLQSQAFGRNLPLQTDDAVNISPEAAQIGPLSFAKSAGDSMYVRGGAGAKATYLVTSKRMPFLFLVKKADADAGSARLAQLYVIASNYDSVIVANLLCQP